MFWGSMTVITMTGISMTGITEKNKQEPGTSDQGKLKIILKNKHFNQN